MITIRVIRQPNRLLSLCSLVMASILFSHSDFHMLPLDSESRSMLDALLYLLHLYVPNIHCLGHTHNPNDISSKKKNHLNKQMRMIPSPILSKYN